MLFVEFLTLGKVGRLLNVLVDIFGAVLNRMRLICCDGIVVVGQLKC